MRRHIAVIIYFMVRIAERMAVEQAEHIWIVVLVGAINAYAIATTDSFKFGREYIIEKANIPLAYGVSFLCWLALTKSDIVQSIFNVVARLWRHVPILLQALTWIAMLFMMKRFPIMKLLCVSFLSCRGFRFLFFATKKQKIANTKVLENHTLEENMTQPVNMSNREVSAIPAVTVIPSTIAEGQPSVASSSSRISTSIELPRKEAIKGPSLSAVKVKENVGMQKKAQLEALPPLNGNDQSTTRKFVDSTNIQNNLRNDLPKLESTGSEFSVVSKDDTSVMHQDQQVGAQNNREEVGSKRRLDQSTDMIIVDCSKRLLIEHDIKNTLLLGYKEQHDATRHTGRPQLKRKATNVLTTSETKLLISYLDETLEMQSKKARRNEQLGTITSVAATGFNNKSDYISGAPFQESGLSVDNSISSIPLAVSKDVGTHGNQKVDSVSLPMPFTFGSQASTIPETPVTTILATAAIDPVAIHPAQPFTFGDSADKSSKTISHGAPGDNSEAKSSVAGLQFKFTLETTSSTVSSSKSGIPSGKPPTPSGSQPTKSVAFGIAFADKSISDKKDSGFTFGILSPSTVPTINAAKTDVGVPSGFGSGSSNTLASSELVGKSTFTFGDQIGLTTATNPTSSSVSTSSKFTFGGAQSTSSDLSSTPAASTATTVASGSNSLNSTFVIHSASVAPSAITTSATAVDSAKKISTNLGGGSTAFMVQSSTNDSISLAKVPSFTFGQSNPVDSSSSSLTAHNSNTSTAAGLFPSSSTAGTFAFGQSNPVSDAAFGAGLTTNSSSNSLASLTPSSNAAVSAPFTFGQPSSAAPLAPTFAAPSANPTPSMLGNPFGGDNGGFTLGSAGTSGKRKGKSTRR